MEARMPGSPEKMHPRHWRSYWAWTRGVFAFYGVLLAVLIGIALSGKPVGHWMSQAANAEFVNSDLSLPAEPSRAQQIAARRN
jgi:hypothetical protein